MPSVTTFCLILFALACALLGWHFGKPHRDRRPPPTARPNPAETVATRPAHLPADPALTPADQATENITAEISRLRSLIAQHERQEAYLGALIAAFTQTNQERFASVPAEAVARTSLFKDDTEFGGFVAALNLRLLAIQERFPDDYTPTEEEKKAADAAFKETIADLSTLMTDPYLYALMKAPTPEKTASFQAAIVAPSLGLDPAQAANLRQLLEAIYSEGSRRNLERVDQPDPTDTAALSAWEQARAELNARATTRIKASLTPEQLKRFQRLGYDQLIYKLRIGVDKPSDR
jgi:hypothetical protein